MNDMLDMDMSSIPWPHASCNALQGYLSMTDAPIHEVKAVPSACQHHALMSCIYAGNDSRISTNLPEAVRRKHAGGLALQAQHDVSSVDV